MRDRVIVRFDDARGTACGVYLHWHGYAVLDWLKEAAPTMRRGDASCASARFVGFCCQKVPGGLSVGILPPDQCTLAEAQWQDNGMVIVNCSTCAIQVAQGPNDKPHTYDVIELGEF